MEIQDFGEKIGGAKKDLWKERGLSVEDLSDLGYTNYWKILNAKDYGIPQNRERLFIISIRQDIAKSNFSFQQPVPLVWKLKDLLEDKVEEKYYLSEKGIRKINKKK